MPLAFCSKFVKVKDLLQLRWNNLYLMFELFCSQNSAEAHQLILCSSTHTVLCEKGNAVIQSFWKSHDAWDWLGERLVHTKSKVPPAERKFSKFKSCTKILSRKKKINQNNSMHTDAIFYDHVLNLSCLKWEWIERMQHHKDGKIQRTMKWTIVQLAWPFSPF